ncbi:uncharacterized protein METZ01_LOCUS186040, partial [marine metagenome]
LQIDISVSLCLPVIYYFYLMMLFLSKLNILLVGQYSIQIRRLKDK